MRIERKKTLLLLAVLLAVALMIGVPLSAASTPTPAYLASGSSMNYVCSTSGYTDSQTYSMHNGIGKTTTSNTTNGPDTYYYNVTVSSSNSTVANVSVPTSSGMTSYTNVPISDAKYMVPIDVKSTSKSVTLALPSVKGNFVGLFGNYNDTFTVSKIVKIPYYKTSFGTVRAVEYVIDEHIVTAKATSTTAESYCNITGNFYVSQVNGVLIGYNINDYSKSVTSGTTAANETYTITSDTYTNALSSTNVVPITTDYTGAYIGIAVAAVILAITVYYFYGRKSESPKQSGKGTENNKKQKE